ncbi:MAG: hypothetical protein WA646_01165, partial [Candidatus Sulfotelmatobacter sp.]
MKGPFRVASLLLVAGIGLSCQTSGSGAPKQSIVSVPDLGFSYTPPAGMIDKTSPASVQSRSHAASYSGRATQLLLDMSSGENDTASDWHHVWIFIIPRAQYSNLSDSAAEGKINTALAGPRAAPVGQPQGAVLAGRNFLVSEFEQKEPPLVKRAKIFTTICKTQLVSFALVSNSGKQVSSMEESLKTLDFSSH